MSQPAGIGHRAGKRPAQALVFGGTGAVGGAVLAGLARAGIPTVFTYHRSEAKAQALAAEHSQRAVAIDLADANAIRRLIRDLGRDGAVPDVFIHCAAVTRYLSLEDISEADWREAHLVNGYSAFVACQELAPKLAGREAHIVLVGAMDRVQSISLPVHFAASQGMLSAMTMTLAKELGPRGIRVNMVALGLLEAGLSRGIAPKLVADFKAFSALRRLGKPEEAARAILWLALENTYMNGEVVPVNGGL
jgi:NAD(P)-dependent dehydrogenase (short-subunit alcohol dehydrogenase family)